MSFQFNVIICSYGTDSGSFGSFWVWKDVVGASGVKITDRSWGGSKLVEVTIEESLESVGLFISDPSFVVLIEVVPCSFEIRIKESWDLIWF